MAIYFLKQAIFRLARKKFYCVSIMKDIELNSNWEQSINKMYRKED